MSKVNNATFLYHIENAIEALEELEVYPWDNLKDEVTRTDGHRDFQMFLWADIDALLKDLRKKRDKVRKTVNKEERESLVQWELVQAQGENI